MKHGRLIDADALKEYFFRPYSNEESYSNIDIGHIIDDQPTVNSSAQPEQSIAQDRYEDLCEYFKDCSDQGRSILNDRKEFKTWLDRMKWHVMECNKLGRELEKLKTAQPEPQWMPRSEPPEEDGVYIVYAPTYSGGSSSAKECHDGVMFSKYKNGKWSIEHGYYSRPNCVKAWKTLDKPWRGDGEPK